MRLAISSEEANGLQSRVSHHFGRCPFYTMVDLDSNKKVVDVKSIANPYYQGHNPGVVPSFIKEHGVNVMISGGMGKRAIDFFNQYSISVFTGANSTVKETVDAYVAGTLSQSSACADSLEHHDK